MTRRPHGPTRHPARGGLIAGAIVVLAIGAGALWSRDHPEPGPAASTAQGRPVGPRTARTGPGPSAEEESGWVPVAPAVPPATRAEVRPSPPRRSPPGEHPRRVPARTPQRLRAPQIAAAAPPPRGAAGQAHESAGPPSGPQTANPGPETAPAAAPPGPAPDPAEAGGAGAESAAAPAPAPTRTPAPAPRPPAPVLTPPVPVVLDPPKHPDAWRIVVETPGLAAGARPAADAARVRLRVLVRDDGTVGDVTIAVSSGRPDLDAAAAAAARGWRFQPARRDGAAIASAVLVWVAFVMAP
jgi:protein TonB